MNIYLVVRSGNEDEGPDGEDTSFMVVANSHLEASALADDMLRQDKVKKVCHYSSHIYQLGSSDSLLEKPVILLGPIVKYFNIPNCLKNWVRYDIEDEWFEVKSGGENT